MCLAHGSELPPIRHIVARWSRNSSVRNHEAISAEFDRGEINPREARSLRNAFELREGISITRGGSGEHRQAERSCGRRRYAVRIGHIFVMLGAATDAAAALLKDPSIANRMVVFWHGRTQWPVRCWNFNAYNDILAVRLLFELKCRLVLFDTGEHLLISPHDGERRFGSLGPLGAYLQEIRHRQAWLMNPRKGIFDLGDIAALVDPSIAPWEKDDAPAVTQDLRYDFTKDYGPMVRIYYIEPAAVFHLLEQALKRIQDSTAQQR